MRSSETDGVRLGLFIACCFAAAAVSSAFLPLWLADRGLTAALIGQVLGLASLLRVVAVPGWGWAADRLGRHRAAMALAAAMAAGAAAMLPAAPEQAAIGILVVMAGLAAATLAPLADALTLALAAAARLHYGRTRAWGSVAYMVATASGGALLGRLGSAAVPPVLAACYAGATLLGLTLPSAPSIRSGPDRVRPETLGPAFRTVLLATALTQGSHAAYYGFASLHWRAAGISDTAIGLLIAEGIVAEVVLFVWGWRLLERIGPARLTALSAIACALRWTATAFTVAVPLLAAIQFLHAATFACQHASSMLVLRTLPPGRAGLAQTLLSALGYSAPTGLMLWLVGASYGAMGGRVFLLMALLGGSALLLAPRLPGGAPRR